MQLTPSQKRRVDNWGTWLLALLALVLPANAATTTNDILGLADFANNGFQEGFGIGLPILILVIMLGWLLFGLRAGLKGRK